MINGPIPRRIAIDFDDTLADVRDMLCRLINYRDGTTFVPEDVKTWTYLYKETDHGRAFWGAYDLMDATHLRRAIRPVSPFACATVKWLQQRGHTVEVVTANHEKAIPDMVSWLFGHGLDCPVRAVGRIDAAEKAKLDYDLFLDDSPLLAEEVRRRALETGSKQRMVLVDRYHNRDLAWVRPLMGADSDWAVPTAHPVVRLLDWADARALFIRLGL